MTKLYTKRIAYGLTPPNINIVADPVQSQRPPTVNDLYNPGQLWLDQTANTAYVLVSYTNGLPVWVQIDNSGITGLNWITTAAAAFNAVNNTGYVVTGNPPTVTLPLISPVGSVIEIIGAGANNWVVQANAAQRIRFGAALSALNGTVTATHPYDGIVIITRQANTLFEVVQTNDNLLVA